MKTIDLDVARAWYLHHRRANFAASQRLEGVTHPVAAKGAQAPLPSKADLLKKYRVTPAR